MSCVEMCPKRKPDQCFVVSGDGFFQEELLTSWGLTYSNFIADYWHLFDSER